MLINLLFSISNLYRKEWWPSHRVVVDWWLRYPTAESGDYDCRRFDLHVCLESHFTSSGFPVLSFGATLWVAQESLPNRRWHFDCWTHQWRWSLFTDKSSRQGNSNRGWRIILFKSFITGLGRTNHNQSRKLDNDGIAVNLSTSTITTIIQWFSFWLSNWSGQIFNCLEVFNWLKSKS